MSARKTTARLPRRRRASSFGRGVATLLGYVTLLVLVSMVVGIVFVAGVFRKVAEDLPSPDTLLNYNPGGITEIYATDKDPRTGKNVLLGRVFSQNKEFVPITQIPAVLKNATIAIEDHRFFSHPGVDLQGIARAVYVNARGGRLLEGQGGSTLTQQLARNIYLTQKKTLSRKAQEIMLAIQIEKNYSKQQILEMYLNEVYYGAGAYGVQAASKVYFGKPVKDLSLSQAALLAGLPQQPSRFDPFVDKKASIARRNTVLAKMAELGYITPQKSKVAQSNGVFLIPPRPKNDGEFKAPYFTNYVIRQLVERYGHEVVYTGGLKVYTTLNWKMQQSAEAALAEGVRRGRRARVTQGALISLEPRTGYIRAMVGGVDFKENQYNNAVQGRRQPGSSFKVIVYTAAFDTNQYGPDSRVNDAPFSLRTGKGKWWRPQNYGGGYRGWVSVRQAMTYSYNTPAVRVVDKIGPSTVISYARKMGIMSPLQPYVPIALGSDAVSPLEMAAAYSIFPNYGNRALPMSIIRVVNHQREVLEENRPSVREAVISETTVRQISSILADVVSHGTAASAAGIHEVPGAHGKTGTTNDNRDAWFVGYTPELSTAVWVSGAKYFHKGNKVTAVYPPMSGVTGGHVCAPIWARFMKTAIAIQRKSGEPIPPAPQKVKPAPDTDVAAAAPAERRRAMWEPAFAASDDDAAESGTRQRSYDRRGGDRRRGDDGDAAGTLALAASSEAASAAAATGTERRSSGGATEVLAMPAVAAPAAVPAARARQTPAPFAAAAEPLPPPRESAVVAPRRAPEEAPPAPREVSATICPDSGLRATRWCPESVTRTFAAGRGPRRSCRVHRPRPGDG